MLAEEEGPSLLKTVQLLKRKTSTHVWTTPWTPVSKRNLSTSPLPFREPNKNIAKPLLKKKRRKLTTFLQTKTLKIVTKRLETRWHKISTVMSFSPLMRKTMGRWLKSSMTGNRFCLSPLVTCPMSTEARGPTRTVDFLWMTRKL